MTLILIVIIDFSIHVDVMSMCNDRFRLRFLFDFHFECINCF